MPDYIPSGIRKVYVFKNENIYSSLIHTLKKSHHEKFFWGWGRKKSFKNAYQSALKQHGRAICVEDGFIRSLGLGKEGYQPLSLVVDQLGIYFDATQSSDLENLILQPMTNAEEKHARFLIQKILKQGITKYNLNYDDLDPVHFAGQQNILVVDQTWGDQSISYSMASADHFKQMLKQAIADHPQATIWVKIHPDVIAGKAKGHFAAEDLKAENIQLLTGNYNPITLCQYMTDIYVVSSQLGFEALMCARRVHCFGMPWYAGWGLTVDRPELSHAIQARRYQQRSLEQLFIAAYLRYAKYVSPVSHKLCELEDIINLLQPNIQFQSSLPKQQMIAYGFSRWKKVFIRDYLDFPHVQLRFRQWRKPHKNHAVVAWGKKAALLKKQGYSQVWTVEDGFLRSLGLGAKLIRPFSLVFDDIGIYYDATQPSRLEKILNEVELDAEQQQRTQHLIQHIIQEKLTKYNVGEQAVLDFQTIPHNKKIVLVVGQVEDDLSVQLGGVDIKTNLALIQQVRTARPDAYIIYKPHPDVEAGLRQGRLDWEEIEHLVNHVETNISITSLFEHINELHTITSLSGFEALLRNIPVYCYGIPFYAGWGLTVDRHICARRQRILTLDELVYSTLIQYPVYNLPSTKALQIPLVRPEDVLEHMLQSRSAQSTTFLSRPFTVLRKVILKFQG